MDDDFSGAVLNGASISPASYTENFVWRDGSADDDMFDDDLDDGNTNTPGDAVVINGVVKTLDEIAVYNNSVIVLGNGTTLTTRIVAFFVH